MKRVIASILAVMVVTASTPLHAREEISELAESTDKIYRTGAGASDGAFTALGLSMMWWGVGLAIGIAVLAAVLNHGSGTGGNAH